MTSRTRRWRWVSPSPSASRSGNERTVADPVSAVASPAALRPPAVPLFSATSPPCPPLAQRICPSRRTVARRRPPIKHMFEVGDVSVSLSSVPAVDIEQQFESNTRSTQESDAVGREERSWGVCSRRCWSSTRRSRRRGGLGWSRWPGGEWSRGGARPASASRPGGAPSRVGVCRPVEPRVRRRAARRHARRARPGPACGPPGGGPSSRPRRRRAPRAGVRLTRRARRLAAVLASPSGVAIGSWLGPLLAGGGGDLQLAGVQSVVVEPGDTLWSIASAVAGDRRRPRRSSTGSSELNGLRAPC